MMRSKRKAAHDAVLRMREIFEWEDVRENSKVFQSCAAKIDMEFERELKKKRLGVQDIEDECCEDDEESSSEEELEVLTREDIEFIEDDGFQQVDKTWMPSKKKNPPGVRQLIDSVRRRGRRRGRRGLRVRGLRRECGQGSPRGLRRGGGKQADGCFRAKSRSANGRRVKSRAVRFHT